MCRGEGQVISKVWPVPCPFFAGRCCFGAHVGVIDEQADHDEANLGRAATGHHGTDSENVPHRENRLYSTWRRG